ncbi:hypothetical protein CQA43_01835 [Helicobacter ganmani]|uniref:Uncharacterized protein n=1 Tax=Helicobacter ganmani TaxID=60246 RepID=A0A3D8IJ16_9HELI|nr:hypothetical protein [uncultured Helicobacter sp.]RDU64561.1 hypothetical protein CQA43_01835 [Helicobacter ganmani]
MNLSLFQLKEAMGDKTTAKVASFSGVNLQMAEIYLFRRFLISSLKSVTNTAIPAMIKLKSSILDSFGVFLPTPNSIAKKKAQFPDRELSFQPHQRLQISFIHFALWIVGLYHKLINKEKKCN